MRPWWLLTHLPLLPQFVNNQPCDENQVQAQEETQSFLIDTRVHESVVFPDIVNPDPNMPEVEDQVQICADLQSRFKMTVSVEISVKPK